MAKIDLKKSIRGIPFLGKLNFFGTKVSAGDQMIFDQRGAIKITDKEITKKNGEIVRIRGIADAGSGGVSMAIRRPTGGNSIDPARAMGAFHGWPYAATKAIAEEISNIEFKCMRIAQDGTHEEVAEHEVINFIEAVNDFQTGPEFKQTLSQHLELTGNAFILLEGVKDYLSKPKAMYLLDPSKVRVILDKTTYPFKVSGYRFTIESREFNYKPYEIIQVKLPDPSNYYMGIGTVQGIAEWVDNDNDSTEFLRQFFKNGATIGMTFETDMVSEEALQALRDSFNEQHSGVQNAYLAMFLPKGVKKPASDVQIKDLGIATLSDSNRDKILAGFRVSKTILGTAESDTNRSTAETADYVFAKRTIKPKMLLICSYLNEFLVPRFAKDVYLTFVDPVPRDKATDTAEMTAATGGHAVMTINEARERFMGLPPIEGGDVLPSGQADPNAPGMSSDLPADAKAVVMKNDWKPAVQMGYRPARVSKGKTQFARNIEMRQEMSKSLAEKITEIVTSIQKKGLKDMSRDEYDTVILKEKLNRTHEAAKKVQAELVRLNNDQLAEVMENLPDALKAVKAIDVSKLFSLKNWISITINAITPYARDLFGTEAKHALELIDKPGIDVDNSPEAKSAIKKAMALMSESYNQSTLDLLEKKLNEGLDQGFGVQKMGELVSDIYAWKDQYAAERVALTESNRIANDAGKIAWKKSGVVKKIEWVTTSRDNVCSFCADMEGTIISIEEDFFDKGDSYTVENDAGDEVTMDMDYSAVGGPPLHPNCHCSIRPIVDTSITAAQILGPEAKPDADITDRLEKLENGRLEETKELEKIIDSAINEIESNHG